MTMLDDPPVDPMGTLIVWAREDPDIAFLVSDRVRGVEPAPGDAKGPGDWQAFVVLTTLADPLHPSVPVTFGEYGVRCYGTTAQNARAVWGAVVRRFHRTTPAVRSPGGIGIYTSRTSGGAITTDPVTGQPYVSGVISVIAAAQAVTT